jgi:hypothetical protein
MRPFLAAVALVGMSLAIAEAADKPASRPKPSTLSPKNDSRLAKRPDAREHKIGLLSYYPNIGGGFTFLEKGDVAFYAMPFDMDVCERDRVERVHEKRNGVEAVSLKVERLQIGFIGTSKLRPGELMICRGQLIDLGTGLDVRKEEPIACWSGNYPKDSRLMMLTDDRETRLKLKSIVPVLERAEHAR